MKDIEEVKEGTIRGVFGYPISGLWHLNIDGEVVHIESGYGARQLVSCFGDLKNTVGKRVCYSTDWLGVLEWFAPIDERDTVGYEGD